MQAQPEQAPVQAESEGRTQGKDRQSHSSGVPNPALAFCPVTSILASFLHPMGVNWLQEPSTKP